MPFLLGVDAGNTKTIALVAACDDAGDTASIIGAAVLGAGRSGCGDIYGARSPGHAIQAIDAAVQQALAAAGLTRAQLAAAAISAAGADWPEDIAFLHDALAERGLPDPQVYNDAIGALRAGSPDGNGVVVAVGTGAAVGARHADGRLWHSSFWQQVQGAGELGQLALRAMYSEALGLGPPTALTPALLAHFKLDSPEQVLHALTARESAADFESRFIHPKTGGVARVLLDVAAQGDAVAVQIVQRQGQGLGDFALVAARQVGLLGQPFTLVLAGGVLRHPAPHLRDALIARVCAGNALTRPAEAPPNSASALESAPAAVAADGAAASTSPVQVIRAEAEPALGALLLACEHLHLPITPTLCACLASTQPPPPFFTT